MGNYIAKADIISQLPENALIHLTDDEGIGIANDGRINAAISDAEGEADGYLSTRYSTPLSPVPQAVKKFTVDIAVYNLYSRADTIPDDRQARYQNAVKFFLNVSKGLVSLGAEKPAPSVNGVDFSSGARTFKRDKLEDF